MIKQSIGLIETRGMVAALQASDAMTKAAKVSIINFYQVGSGLICVMVEGEVAAVQSAVQVGIEAAKKLGEIVSYNVIPRPHDEVSKLIEIMDL